MRGTALLGRILGIPLRIHWSAPALLLFFGYGLAAQTLPAWVPGRSATAYGVAGVVGAALLAGSLLLHETAHAVTARRAGVRVDDMTVFALGGVTRMGRAPTPRVQFTVAGSGPLTSLLLGGLFLGAGLGVWDGPHWRLPAAVLLWDGWANLLLGVFNLLPAAPLDGGRLLQAAVWRRGGDRERAERVAGRTGQAAGLLMSAGGFVAVLRGDAAGFWFVLVGLFVWSSALAEVRRATMVAALRGVRVAQVMTAPAAAGPDWLTVDRFLADLATRTHQQVVAVLDFDGRPSGLVDLTRLLTVPSARRAAIRVRELARPLRECTVAGPGDDLLEVLDHATTQPPILVLDDGRLVGIVTTDDIARAAQLRTPASPGATSEG
ncbi:CBS domain-containing protein [Kitasatospora acidiphila]|uniref:Zinc metalloprotease n=1 Tax=Kitasatospora acidiphila TaxID=2567942 RepID=A0A540VWV0_9ACTN|nr:site-2 protease family protein [Kitasatospora acidiphila]TQF01240.1 CBS domain-containing protein [Kitasatospora acidiphila]